MKFKSGDVVVVISDCVTCGRTGVVINYEIDHYSWGRPKYNVRLDYNGMTLKYNEDSLELSCNQKEENNMAKLTGYKKVAEISINHNTYYYALYDDVVEAGDKVLITGRAAGQMYTVKNVWSIEEAVERYKGTISEEVICKVDQSAYEKRVADRAEKAKIRKEMDAMIKKMDETQKYKMYAEMNPDLAALLAKFETLEG